jgi:hypothetical protein
MPTVITTSTASTATAYSNQRKIDRCQNGVLWMMDRYTSGITNAPGFAHSTDNGATWTVAPTTDWGESGTANRYENGSLFIDLDDYAHVAYKNQRRLHLLPAWHPERWPHCVDVERCKHRGCQFGV